MHDLLDVRGGKLALLKEANHVVDKLGATNHVSIVSSHKAEPTRPDT